MNASGPALWLGLACVVSASHLLDAQAARGSGTAQPLAAPAETLLHVQGNVYALIDEVANVVIQVGDAGVLVVDPGPEDRAPAVIAAIRRLSDKPIHYIINTQARLEHTGANERLAAAARDRPLRNPIGAGLGGNTGDQTSIVAHERVLHRMSGVAGEPPPARTVAAWPTDTFHRDLYAFFFNGEAIEVLHQPRAHSDGDSLVFFRRSDVIAAGDLFLTTSYPAIDRARGGSVEGVIAGLNRIIRLAVPTYTEEGGTMIVPGHGRISDEIDVVEYRNMVTIVRDRVMSLIAAGKSLDEIRRARPTQDYDPRYGVTPGETTGDEFVRAVYESLVEKQGASQ